MTHRLTISRDEKLRWIDGHLDLAYLYLNGRDIRREADDPAAGCVTLPALRRAGVQIAFATIYTEPGEPSPQQPHLYSASDVDSAEQVGLRQLEVYVRLEAAGEVAIVRTASNIDLPAPLPRILILMEGADPIRSPEHVPSWKERGVRLVGLTWATGTRYAGGNAGNPGEGPLTALGVEMVRALDEAGIVHDASHLSDAAFEGLLEHAAGPIVASHSNCRALLEPRQRHLRDDQIRTIARRDGIIGLNLYSPFLARDRRANIADCVAHLEHVCEIAGHRRCVALGSDMDGGFTPNHLPTGLDRPEALEALAEALRDAGWSDDEVRGFASGNWRRFLSGLSW